MNSDFDDLATQIRRGQRALARAKRELARLNTLPNPNRKEKVKRQLNDRGYKGFK
jgi:SOS response regulatory protein OraA/RecX